MVMVTVEILEIEVLFCTYVWVTSYILMVEKAIKKGLFHTEQAFFYMHVSEIIHPNSLLPYVCKKHNVSWPFLRKQQIDLLLQQDTVSLQKQNELRSSRNPGNLPISVLLLESSMNGFLPSSSKAGLKRHKCQ